MFNRATHPLPTLMTRAAADQLTIGLVIGRMTLLVCPLIGAYAGFIAGKNQIRRLQDTHPPGHLPRRSLAS
jgi:hypothetical protein